MTVVRYPNWQTKTESNLSRISRIVIFPIFATGVSNLTRTLSRGYSVFIDSNFDVGLKETARVLTVSAISWRCSMVRSSRPSWHDAKFGNGTPVEIKSTVLEHSDGQPGNFKVYRKHHEKLRRADGWYCFVVYRPHGRSGCRIVKDGMCKASSLAIRS
jgi:hypothetical protein